MMENFKIEPLIGYGDLHFRMPIDDVVEVLGQPTNQEEIESNFEFQVQQHKPFEEWEINKK